MKIGPNPGKEGTVYEPFDISVSEKFIIMILADPDVQSSPALQGRQLEYSEMLRLSGQCAEIFDSQLPEDFRTEHHDGGGFLSFVLCTDCEDTSPQDHEKLWQELRAALNRALELCFDRLDLRLRLSVSSAHPNNGSVYDAFQEAFSIAEHFSFLDNGRLIITSDDLFMPVGGSAVRPELEKLWFGYTADCSYDAAKQTLKSIVAQKSAAPATTVTLKPELISRLDYTIYMLCDCSGIGRTNGDFLLRKVEELRAAKNIDDLYGGYMTPLPP